MKRLARGLSLAAVVCALAALGLAGALAAANPDVHERNETRAIDSDGFTIRPGTPSGSTWLVAHRILAPDEVPAPQYDYTLFVNLTENGAPEGEHAAYAVKIRILVDGGQRASTAWNGGKVGGSSFTFPMRTNDVESSTAHEMEVTVEYRDDTPPDRDVPPWELRVVPLYEQFTYEETTFSGSLFALVAGITLAGLLPLAALVVLVWPRRR